MGLGGGGCRILGWCSLQGGVNGLGFLLPKLWLFR